MFEKQHADSDEKNEIDSSTTTLQTALQAEDHGLVYTLIENGANINATPFEIILKFVLFLIRDGNADCLRIVFNYLSEEKLTLILTARDDSTGWSLLALACEYGHEAVVDVLLNDVGFDPNILSQHKVHGKDICISPLLLAIKNYTEPELTFNPRIFKELFPVEKPKERKIPASISLIGTLLSHGAEPLLDEIQSDMQTFISPCKSKIEPIARLYKQHNLQPLEVEVMAEQGFFSIGVNNQLFSPADRFHLPIVLQGRSSSDQHEDKRPRIAEDYDTYESKKLDF